MDDCWSVNVYWIKMVCIEIGILWQLKITLRACSLFNSSILYHSNLNQLIHHCPHTEDNLLMSMLIKSKW